MQSDEQQPNQGSPDGAHNRKVLSGALTSESFVEKAALLLLTVILSGIAVPLAVNWLNAHDAERKKFSDIAKAKEDANIVARHALLNDFSDVLLTYETLALDLSWYRTTGVNDRALHEKAYARYTDRVVELFTKWRVLTSRAQILADPGISKRMESFLKDVFAKQDTPLTQLHTSKASTAEWEAQHIKSESMLGEANKLISDLGAQMGLVSERDSPR